jgi:hypothetical protein
VAGRSIGQKEKTMITDTLPPVISTGTYNELLEVKRLAKNVYLARTNFADLCDQLEHLYSYFDEETLQEQYDRTPF